MFAVFLIILLNSQALQLNDENVNKWKNYKEELNETKKNLSQFIKSHSLEIMIPVGKKALIKGKLVHTNEVTVCHGASYFSECCTSQAIEIIESRIEKCDNQLEALNKERKLFM